MTVSVGTATGSSKVKGVGGSAPALMTNLLYPFYTLDPDTAALGPNVLRSGLLVYIPIDMTTTTMIQFTLSQVSLTEDYSLRSWVSRYPFGQSVCLPEFFPVMRMSVVPVRPLIVYTSGQPSMNSILAAVLPGQYYLNILNLTNTANVFTFAQTILA